MISVTIAPAAQPGNASGSPVGEQTGEAVAQPGFIDLFAAVLARAIGAKTDVALPVLAGHADIASASDSEDGDAKAGTREDVAEGPTLGQQVCAPVIPSPVESVVVQAALTDRPVREIELHVGPEQGPWVQAVPGGDQKPVETASSVRVTEAPLVTKEHVMPRGVTADGWPAEPARALAADGMESASLAELSTDAAAALPEAASAQHAHVEKLDFRLADPLRRTLSATIAERVWPRTGNDVPRDWDLRPTLSATAVEPERALGETAQSEADPGSELAGMLVRAGESARRVQSQSVAAAKPVVDKPDGEAPSEVQPKHFVGAPAHADASSHTQTAVDATQAHAEHRSLMPELHRRVIDQVVKEVRLQRLSDGHGLTVKLQPPELGTLHIRLVSDSAGVTSQIEAGSLQVRNLLQAHLPMIADAMSNAGVRVDSVTVTSTMDLTASGHGTTREHGQSFHSGQHGRRETETVNFSGEQGSFYRQESATYSWLA